jgi:hypothetical protein
MENKFQFIDVIKELERVELAPLIMPLLKIIDPIAKQIPEGTIREFLTHIRPLENQFNFLYKVAPILPRMVRWAGKVASIKPLMVVFGIVAEVLSRVLMIAMPVVAALARAIISIAAMAKKACAHQTT